MEDNGRIHGIPIRVEVTTDTSLEQYSKEPPAGIFLVQEISDDLERVINFGKLHKIIVFSPFEGDVEAGVLGGIHISERMLPYINQRTLDASGIKIKPFFLRVSKHYED
ncbi:hypothetical protein [Desulfospira joergensenii]|uniref:hypothetical protein n=1 Tax=Desulfospira joergensenii TaxID=53329 RepID=UPI0003B508E5|nr:hypothetical protein [Desulfospira joergensenii]